jgi:fucose permease
VTLRRPIVRARWAVAAVFVVHGVLFASWTAHIPQVKNHIGLDNRELGVALVGAPIGSALAILAAASLLHRFGSPAVMRVALLGYCASGPLVGLAGSLAALLGALALWGAFMGLLDISMNTQAVSVERLLSRQLMTGLHGSWSIGSFAGAGLGALGVAIGLSLSVQLVVLGIAGVLVGIAVSSGLVADPPPLVAADQDVPVHRFSRAVVVLGLIAAASMLAEGAAADWAAVYLKGTAHASAAIAGLGYAVFALAMVVVRFAGHRLLETYSARRLLPALAVFAIVGFGAGLLTGRVVVAMVGFATLGIGLGLVVPAVFSACGRLTGISAGTAIATASGFGWLGFLLGPPLIGQLAGVSSLPVALGLVPVLLLAIAASTATNRAMDVPRT